MHTDKLNLKGHASMNNLVNYVEFLSLLKAFKYLTMTQDLFRIPSVYARAFYSFLLLDNDGYLQPYALAEYILLSMSV